MSIQICVTLSEPQARWLKNNRGSQDCSPTFLLRQAIYERMHIESDETYENNAQLRNKIVRIMETIDKMHNFINEKGLTDEWIKKT